MSYHIRMAVIHYIELLPFRESASACGECCDYICKMSLRGSLSMDNAQETAVLLQTLMDGGIRRFIINMENLNYVDSTGIGTIIKIKKTLIHVGGELVLFSVPPKVNDVFELVNLKE
ncbi:MAG: anti-sigma factor antagonist, partial [Spirochaetales bacterium]